MTVSKNVVRHNYPVVACLHMANKTRIARLTVSSTYGQNQPVPSSNLKVNFKVPLSDQMVSWDPIFPLNLVVLWDPGVLRDSVAPWDPVTP